MRLLERKAFDQITIKEISAEAGVHNATFFRHHTDKESLLDHVAADEIDRLVAFSMQAGYGLAGYKALCEYITEHRTLWRALLTGGAGGAMREEYMRVSKAVAADYAETEGWLPRELGIICSTTLIVETISWWLSQADGTYSANQIARILNELVTSAVAGPAPKVRKARRKSGGD
ncbi:MAG TPA: TetR/AcrR family transcriptional regulator [Sphingobium sp.]|uniref:TetR/AcrR family transcriptional regulator n=1 Tax=Sphingobium sp. TaxID=1912891 RepID=UPI002ED44BEF